MHQWRRVIPIAALCVLLPLLPSPAGATSLSSVLAAVKSATSIQKIPKGLTPTLAQASTDTASLKVSAVNYIKKSCDPYWTHQQAGLPVPCWYGDTSAKKVVVFWGDSNTGNWVPALSALFKRLHYRLALFAFIGCDTSFMPETSSQLGFPGEWQLCNEWHQSLPIVVRKLKPVMLIDASTMFGRVGNAAYNASWVQGMTLAFNEMTQGLPSTIRVEMQTVPSRKVSPTACLSSAPTNVESCATNLNDTSDYYPSIKARDQQIATDAHAILIPTWPLMCYQSTCPPIVGKTLVLVDNDHFSTPYADYVVSAVATEFSKLKALPPKA